MLSIIEKILSFCVLYCPVNYIALKFVNILMNLGNRGVPLVCIRLSRDISWEGLPSTKYIDKTEAIIDAGLEKYRTSS